MLQVGKVKSCFGPCGRSKILKGITGTIQITKDGKQLLSILSTSYTSYELFYYQFLNCYIMKYDDGVMTLCILISSLFSENKQLLEDINSITSIRYRSSMIQSLSILLQMIRSFKQEIIEIFQVYSICKWMEVNNQLIEKLCSRLLVPASNYGVAHNLTQILVGWLQENHWFDIILKEKLAFLKYATTNFEDIFLTASYGELTSSYSAPRNHLFFEGRCRNLPSLHIHNSPSNGFPFICIQSLSERIRDDESLRQYDPTVQVSSLSQLDLPYLTTSELVLEIFHQYHPSVDNPFIILTSDSVHDCIHFAAAKSSIIFVDKISENQLIYIANRLGAVAFDSGSELKQFWKDGHRRPIPTFKTIEKISLGKGDPLLRIIGMDTLHSTTATYPRQLVIRGCSSTAIGGVYRRLLKRCLTTIAAALNSSQYSSEKIKDEVLCCVGSGIMELVWAVFWEDMSKSLISFNSLDHPSSPFYHLIHLCHQYLSPILHQHHLQSSLIMLCQQISISYLQIPSILLSNSQRSTSPSSSFRNHRQLLIWKDQLHLLLLEQKPIQEFYSSYHVGGEEGSLNTHSVFPVWDLGEAFFDGFFTTMEAYRIHLRVGGEKGIVQVKKKFRNDSEQGEDGEEGG